MACQKVTTFHPNSAGISQFHNDITINPNRATNSTAMGKNFNALMNLLFIFYSFSALLELFVNGPQSAAQVQYRVALAREQRVYADARLLCHLLKAVAQQLVPDEYLSLFFGQLEQGIVDFLQQNAPDVGGLGPGIRRRQ